MRCVCFTGQSRRPQSRPAMSMSATAKDQRCGHHSHKRETNARLSIEPHRAAAHSRRGPLALMATLSAVSLGVLRATRSSSPVVAEDRDHRPPTIDSARPSRDRGAGHPRPTPAVAAASAPRSRRPNAMSKSRRSARPSSGADTGCWTTDDAQPLDRAGQEGRARRRARGRQEGAGHRPRDVGPRRDRRRRQVPLGDRRLPHQGGAAALGGACTNGTRCPAA